MDPGVGHPVQRREGPRISSISEYFVSGSQSLAVVFSD